MNRINFRLRTLLYFLIVSIIPFAVSWAFIYDSYYKKMQQDFRSFNHMYIQNQFSKIGQQMYQHEMVLKSVAQAYSFLDPQTADLNAFLRDQNSVNLIFRNLSIIMPDNSVYTGNPGYLKPDINYTLLFSYINAKKAQGLVWLESYKEPLSGVQCVGMSIPLLDNNNKASGVLVGNISLWTFENLLSNAKYLPYAEVFLVNPAGYVKYHSGNKYSEIVNVTDKDFFLSPAADSILKSDEGYEEFSYAGKNWLCSFSSINSAGWKVLSLIDAQMLQSTFGVMNQNINRSIMSSGILCILIGIAASFFMSNSITTPLIKLRDGVKAITEGNLNNRIIVKGDNEIREVADAFNEMASNLNKTYTDLVKRTEELYANNEELHNINIELEASYGQLGATVAQLNESDAQLRRKNSELQTLNKISNALNSTMDLCTMLITVVNKVTDMTESLVCTIRLINEKDPYKLELKAMKGINTEMYDIGTIDIREDVIGKAVKTGSIYIIDLDNEKVPHEYFMRLNKEHDAKCIVFTPIMVKSKVIGVLSIALKQIPSEELIELLNSLTNSIAIALDNAKAYESLKQSYHKTVQSLVSVVEAKDQYTESHSIRVAKYASFIASELNYPKNFIEDIWVAGLLHDIGKIGISDSILNKPGALTKEEYDIIKQHPEIAYKIVSQIGLRENVLKAIKHHHERCDGKGYPDMIKDDEIPIMASIISVADAFDAITSNRPYRESRSMKQGIDEIIMHRGTQFKPVVAETLEKVFLTKHEILERIYNDEEIEFF